MQANQKGVNMRNAISETGAGVEPRGTSREQPANVGWQCERTGGSQFAEAHRSTPATATALLIAVALFVVARPTLCQDLAVTPVDGQPLAANVLRLIDALAYLGRPLPLATRDSLRDAASRRDADAIQRQLDPHVLLSVDINAESRVKVGRGPAQAALQQAGFTPVLIKIHNQSTGTQRLRVVSPQSGAVYAGVSQLSMQRQQQPALRENENVDQATDRFLSVDVFSAPPMTDTLSGLEVEYAIALIYSSESGRREASIGFDIGQGNQDLGFRGEVPILFDIRPAIAVKLRIVDEAGDPTIAKLLFRDRLGHVYPPQPKRLAPDLFFQPYVYRADGDVVVLPPGKLQMQSSRGPEYRLLTRSIVVPNQPTELEVELERWVAPKDYGFFSGDHHIHAAGCAHYTSPTEGVSPADMFRQVKGEGLNVGCVLTWGPCFDYQRRFFSPQVDQVSEPWTIVKYDLEISGFGSQALGHVCLLNLQDQTYPGSGGTSTEGWPTWTTPVMRWAKEQGAITGYAHSASGLWIDPESAAGRILFQYDHDKDGYLADVEASECLLPENFEAMDHDHDSRLSRMELIQSIDRAADRLPNLAVPQMNGVGAMEICVSVVEGVCDFISAMDTRRIQEWNTWYHLLNCGFPLKVSGETDFPCMSSRRVGQGRVYVRLGETERVDFDDWCRALAAGKSYVSDGYAHALSFSVNGISPGDGDVELAVPGSVRISAQVAFGDEIPLAVAHGTVDAPAGRRVAGDTVVLHGDRLAAVEQDGRRTVELIVNGEVAAAREVPADAHVHSIDFEVDLAQSSWVALRHFPQMHTNPVNVLVGGKPIRASRNSALWCIETIKLLWKNRRARIAEHERDAARAAFDRAIDRFRLIAQESVE